MGFTRFYWVAMVRDDALATDDLNDNPEIRPPKPQQSNEEKSIAETVSSVFFFKSKYRSHGR